MVEEMSYRSLKITMLAKATFSFQMKDYKQFSIDFQNFLHNSSGICDCLQKCWVLGHKTGAAIIWQLRGITPSDNESSYGIWFIVIHLTDCKCIYSMKANRQRRIKKGYMESIIMWMVINKFRGSSC